jgi:putative GTP pyrophosphokinase
MERITINYWIENKNRLQKEYDRRRARNSRLLDLFLDDLEKKLGGRARNAMVKGRLKEFEAFYRKLLEKSQKHSIADPFEYINDLIGLRIVVPFIEDIQNIEARIKEHYAVVETKYKHQERSIRDFGYDSTHLLVTVPEALAAKVHMKEAPICEIQIRTILQDAWAEVEHELVYKTSIDKVEDTIRRKLIALNATLSLADITFQEIRDYQRRRILEIEERHTRILDKVSTVPKKMGDMYLEAFKPSQNLNMNSPESRGELTDTEINNIFYEALNAHISNNLGKAIELYTRLIAISPNHYVYNHRGLVYFSLSKYEEALNDFNMAIRMEPNDTRVYTNRGLTYHMLKELAKALADFNKSLELNPLWPDTFYGRALTYYDMGNLHSALEDCDKAIALKPDFKQAVKFKQYMLNQSME